MRVYTVAIAEDPHNKYAVTDVKDVIEQLTSAEVGDSFVVGVIEMSEEEFDNLEEFLGF